MTSKSFLVLYSLVKLMPVYYEVTSSHPPLNCCSPLLTDSTFEGCKNYRKERYKKNGPRASCPSGYAWIVGGFCRKVRVLYLLQSFILVFCSINNHFIMKNVLCMM